LKRRWGVTCTQPTASNPFPPTPQPHKNKKHKKHQILSPTHNLQSFGKNLQFHESDVLKFRWVTRHLIKDLKFLGCKHNNPKEDYKQLQIFLGRFQFDLMSKENLCEYLKGRNIHTYIPHRVCAADSQTNNLLRLFCLQQSPKKTQAKYFEQSCDTCIIAMCWVLDSGRIKSK
jgi:hypothetical protein